ncbi:esterase/lipase family protein [Ideonella sp. BN130291]|uniref:esterase/lipase family protein n=1 Tax=Ideonella sp. BN130291 TaxID=3112940 RepID=UPI002E26D3DA|nr:hypothetical protein [Ideonella sp. BN130291]
MEAPFFPIIYVRGYAMTEGERNETAADPFCGFNVGSTMYRATVNRNEPPKKFIFESPFLRLASDFGYRDVYENGADIMDRDWQPPRGNTGIPARSVVIYRYYDAGSSIFGDGRSSDIEDYARGLDGLIQRVRELVCAQEPGLKPEAFRCYLVAHSMGGLVVRAFLQNKALGSVESRAAVDKVFTYATPHNGIDLLGINVPGWLTLDEINTFNHRRMAQYLALEAVATRYQRVDFVHESVFPLDRIFCLVGTNRSDYEVAKGLSRSFVGHGSDGLVKVENASVWGLDDNDVVTRTCATAYAYRSHSGHYGIVNSEEAYQNLVRFLFGDVRVDLWLQVDAVALPEEIDGKNVDALYQFELLARPRGKRWYLSRRVAEEDSPACRTHQQLTDPAAGAGARLVYLSTVFLANRAKVSTADRTLSYSMDVRIRVPDYEVDRAFWPNQHYEGSYLFRDSLVVVLEPPEQAGGDWMVKYSWESKNVGEANLRLPYQQLADDKLRMEVPFSGPASGPSIRGKVVLIAWAWNT